MVGLLASAASSLMEIDRARCSSVGGGPKFIGLAVCAYDQSQINTSAFAQVEFGPVPEPCTPGPNYDPRADFNNDGQIDGADFGVFGAAFGAMTGDPAYLAAADFNGDGRIDGADFGTFGAAFGSACN